MKDPLSALNPAPVASRTAYQKRHLFPSLSSLLLTIFSNRNLKYNEVAQPVWFVPSSALLFSCNSLCRLLSEPELFYGTSSSATRFISSSFADSLEDSGEVASTNTGACCFVFRD